MESSNNFKDSESELWNLFPEEYRTIIRKISRPLVFQKGEIVFQEEEPFKGFYWVHFGKFKIYNINYLGKESILRIVEPGHLIGAPLLLKQKKTYPVNLEALEFGSLFFFDSKLTLPILKDNPEIRNVLINMSFDYLFFLKEKTTSLMQNSLNERLMNYFAEKGACDTFVSLGIHKNQLALLLNASPEAISRSFRYLIDNQFIEESNEKYRIIKFIDP